MDQIIEELLIYNIEDSVELNKIKTTIKDSDFIKINDILFLNKSHIENLKIYDKDNNIKLNIYIYLYKYKIKDNDSIKNKILILLKEQTDLKIYTINLKDYLNCEFNKLNDINNFENQIYIDIINKLLECISFNDLKNFINNKNKIHSELSINIDNRETYNNILLNLIKLLLNFILSNKTIIDLIKKISATNLNSINTDEIKLSNLKEVEKLISNLTLISVLNKEQIDILTHNKKEIEEIQQFKID